MKGFSLRDVDNVYRTKHYIITQSLRVNKSIEELNTITSFDVFYKRTRLRDKMYEKIFYDRKHIDGKRLPCTMTSRRYVD